MKKSVLIAVLLAAVVVVTQAQATTMIVQSRSGGLNFGNYSDTGGWAPSSGSANAPGCVPDIGSVYSGTSVYYGPTRQAIFSFTPTDTLQPGESLLLHVDLTWPSTAGQTDTAVVLYTGVSYGGETDPWGNAGPGDVVARTTMDMYYRAHSIWNEAFDAIVVTPGVTYKVGVYGGHQQSSPANRVSVAAAQFITTVIPEPASLTFVGLGLLALIRRRR